jgi:hypothetical protein
MLSGYNAGRSAEKASRIPKNRPAMDHDFRFSPVASLHAVHVLLCNVHNVDLVMSL